MLSIQEKLREKGLKITPQRMAIYKAVLELKNHPAAENIIDFIQENHPNISVGTVYKVLNIFVENKLLRKVKSEKDIMRYDAIMEHHHHLYCNNTDRIADYEDKELDNLVEEYFKKKKIKNFKIEEVKLQITGKFIKT